MVPWSELCQVAAVAFREVVSAAQQGAVPIQRVKELLDRLRYHLCCLPICVATWLCSHVQVSSVKQKNEKVKNEIGLKRGLLWCLFRFNFIKQLI